MQFNLLKLYKMLEELITNTFLEIKEKEDEYLLKSIDLDCNIQINSLSNILSDKNNKKNIKSSNKIDYKNVEYFKNEIKNININEIVKTFNKIFDDYNEVITILEGRIKKFKKKIDKQILLIKKVINIYNSSIKSNNITYQIIFNTKNILHFNPIIKKEFFPDKYQFNFEYDFLKTFSVDKFIEENITIENIQKTSNIKISRKNDIEKNEISSLLFLEDINKFICYNKNKIISFNLKNFKKESEIQLKDTIISLNLTKDKNIYLGFSNSIKKLKFEKNQIIIENYIDDISLDIPGKIIKYKNSIAWTNNNYIGLLDTENYYDINDQLNIEWNSWSGYSKSMLLDLIEYKNDYIIYLYSLEYSDHHGEGGFNVHLGSYEEKLSQGEQIDLEEANDKLFSGCDRWYLKKNYKLLNFEKDKIAVITVKTVFIINVSKWEIINNVSLSQNNINNSYCLHDNYFLFLFNNDPCYDRYNYRFAETLVKQDEKKNIIIFKIDESNKKELYESKLKMKNNCDYLYYININNKNYIITITYNDQENNLYDEITFYEIIDMKNNKKLNINMH